MEENRKIQLDQYDKNMSLNNQLQDGLKWLSPLQPPFQIAGFPWFSHDKAYRRMPVSPSCPLPEAVDWLANCTAGGQLRFTTNAMDLYIEVRLRDRAGMYHMPATGQCGFDSYIGAPGEQKFVSTASFQPEQTEYKSKIMKWPTAEHRHVTLNFPLYQGVEEVRIGINEEAEVWAPPIYKNDKRVIIYGTSITQGGCASRPGMAYPNILSRRLDIEIINLGFSGSGKGEPNVAKVISEIPNPACFVLDYEANSGGLESLKETLPNFIEIYRAKHPIVPILVVSRIKAPGEAYDSNLQQTMIGRKQYQRELVDQLRAKGDANLHFHDGSAMLGDYYNESTVDGTHPTDLGFMLMADSLYPVLEELI